MEINPNKNHSKEQSIINAERQSYLFRLRKKSFQDLELSKCETVEQIYKVTQDIQESKDIAENHIKLAESQKWKNFKIYSDVDEYPGIPITVELDQNEANEIIEYQNKNSYKIITENDFYNQEQYELFCKKKSELINAKPILKETIQNPFVDISKRVHDFKTLPRHEVDNFNDDSIKNSSAYLRYLQNAKDGKYATLIIAGFQLPAHGTYTKSCGQFMVDGCVGSGIDYYDMDARTGLQVIQDTKHRERESDAIKGRLHVCGLASCPVCVDKSITNKAIKAVDRMMAYAVVLDSSLFAAHQILSKKQKRILNHFVVSIPKKDYSLMFDEKGHRKIKGMVRKNLKKIGIEGGAEIFHPFRFGKDIEYGFTSPHLHYVVCGWTDSQKIKNLSVYGYAVYDSEINDIRRKLKSHGKKLEKIPKEDRYVYHSIRTFDDELNLFFTLRYLLCHAAVRENYDMVRYFGSCQNRYFKTDNILINAFDVLDDQAKKIEKMRYNSTLRDFGRVTGADIELRQYEDLKIKNGVLLESYHVNNESDLLNKLSYIQDNPAKAKSDLFIVVKMQLHYNEECQREVLFCWYLDPDISSLCEICSCKMKSLILIDKNRKLSDMTFIGQSTKIDFDDLVNNQYFPDHNFFRYIDPKIDYLDGLSYFDEKLQLQHDLGERYVNPNMEKMPINAIFSMQNKINESLFSVEIKKIKKRLMQEENYYNYDGSINYDLMNEEIAKFMPVIPMFRNSSDSMRITEFFTPVSLRLSVGKRG